MEEGVSDRKDEKNKTIEDRKEAECPYDTPPVDLEEVVSDRKDDKNEKLIREKRQNA